VRGKKSCRKITGRAKGCKESFAKADCNNMQCNSPAELLPAGTRHSKTTSMTTLNIG
jgi:hypothetical protein